jgi:hypothetical protein
MINAKKEAESLGDPCMKVARRAMSLDESQDLWGEMNGNAFTPVYDWLEIITYL